jgi:hypothetical protein
LILELQGNFVFGLLEAFAVKTEMQPVRADARPHRVEQDRLQVAAVDGELRPAIARAPPERLAVDELAEAVEERRFGGLDRHLRERVLQTQVRQHARRVRQEVDAHAHRLDLGRRLEHPARNLPLMQLEREREPADAAADDENVVHGENRGQSPISSASRARK